MRLRFISPTIHGIIDYSAAVGLISAPFILQLGDSSSLAIWISVVTGFAVVAASSMTDYRYGVFRNIPFAGHLAIDLSVATAFMAIPFLLSFTGLDAYYYWINAAVVYLVVSLSASN